MMSRIRYIGGKLTEIVEGEYNMYSASNITYNAKNEIRETGVQKGVSYGEPKAPPEIDIKPKKIKFRPTKISPLTNIISVIEKIDETLQVNDSIFIEGQEIRDNWISLNGKLYLIPTNMSLYGNVFFRVNEHIYQSLEQISNCKSFQDYKTSIIEQLEILKEFTKDFELSNIKHKQHIIDRLSYDGHFRYITCIEEIEALFLNTTDYENVKAWIIKNLG